MRRIAGTGLVVLMLALIGSVPWSVNGVAVTPTPTQDTGTVVAVPVDIYVTPDVVPPPIAGNHELSK